MKIYLVMFSYFGIMCGTSCCWGIGTMVCTTRGGSVVVRLRPSWEIIALAGLGCLGRRIMYLKVILTRQGFIVAIATI